MCSYHSELYGLSLEAVEIVARESLACVVHMELEVSSHRFTYTLQKEY